MPLQDTKPSDVSPSTNPESGRSRIGRGLRFGTGGLVEGKFRLKRSLGRGGMAEVMLAQDLALDREVAIKFLGKGLLTEQSFRDRFAVEARNMARVQHPNVARIYSFGVHEGWPYFAMEFVDGCTLADWSKAHRFPPLADVAWIVRQVASGLEAIHGAGLVHHDVKPANILLDRGGRIVVTDLGLSRVVSTFGPLQAFAGTPRYMAPEQSYFRPLPVGLAQRTDVYQLAITTYELLVGKPPFEGATLSDIVDAHRKLPPPRPSATRPELNDAVDRAVLVGLSKDPNLRQTTPMAFAEDLEIATVPTLHRRAQSGPHRPVRVLVADADRGRLRNTCALLRAELVAGSSIEGARDGNASLRAAELVDFDVVLLDVDLPVLSAPEVAAALARAANGKRPHVIMVSEFGALRDARLLREAGADTSLLRPFNADQLIAAVEQVSF